MLGYDLIGILDLFEFFFCKFEKMRREILCGFRFGRHYPIQTTLKKARLKKFVGLKPLTTDNWDSLLDAGQFEQ